MPRASGQGSHRSNEHRRKRRCSELKPSCVNATLGFAGVNLAAECQKQYLSSDSWLGIEVGVVTSNDIFQNPRLAAKVTMVVPSDSNSLVVSWTLIAENVLADDLTRYVITVERFNECNLTPVVKFQVPLSSVAKNDCEQTEVSKRSGTTRPFRVKLCAGDVVIVAITNILAGKCQLLECGATCSPVVQDAVNGLVVARVQLTLF